MQPSEALKRFYKTVDVAADGAGFVILLDNRHLKSPAKRPLVLPTRALADAIAAEWAAQKKYIKATTMPLMALAATAVDRISEMRAGVEDQICQYGETDLICYHTNDPADLAARQIKAWGPYLEWMRDTYNAPLETQIGVLHKPQPAESLTILAGIIRDLSIWELAALSSATHCTGSIVLGLALITGKATAEQIFEDSQVDETYQIEQWGEDYETADRRAALKIDLAAVERWMALYQDS